LVDMNQHSLILRDAAPTFDEGLVFARYLNEVAEGFIQLMYGQQFADIVATAYCQTDHDYSFQNVVFAERDKAIVGMAAGYTAEQHRHSSDQPLKQAPGYPAVRKGIVGALCAPLLRILDTLADGDFYLLSIGVDRELRGEGVGSRLIDSIEARARASGAIRLALDVSAKNGGARKLYERRGMAVESQWPKRLTIPGLKLLRMTKTL
jgi:ribosomal protein S18 acetylase RimI-like enzyme